MCVSSLTCRYPLLLFCPSPIFVPDSTQRRSSRRQVTGAQHSSHKKAEPPVRRLGGRILRGGTRGSTILTYSAVPRPLKTPVTSGKGIRWDDRRPGRSRASHCSSASRSSSGGSSQPLYVGTMAAPRLLRARVCYYPLK